jgi:hypothetical protein
MPDGKDWIFEIKLDGYRAIAVKNESSVILYSRNHTSLNQKFPYIVEALRHLATSNNDPTAIHVLNWQESGRRARILASDMLETNLS